MNLYIAGPMSGIAEHNYPAFRAAAKALRERGHNVISPHETSPCHDHSDPLPWTYYVKRDLAVLVTYCDAIVLLPGYEKSRGAMLELTVADALGYPVYLWVNEALLDTVTNVAHNSVLGYSAESQSRPGEHA